MNEEDFARTERMLNFIGKAVAFDNAKKFMELAEMEEIKDDEKESVAEADNEVR